MGNIYKIRPQLAVEGKQPQFKRHNKRKNNRKPLTPRRKDISVTLSWLVFCQSLMSKNQHICYGSGLKFTVYRPEIFAEILYILHC